MSTQNIRYKTHAILEGVPLFNRQKRGKTLQFLTGIRGVLACTEPVCKLIPIRARKQKPNLAVVMDDMDFFKSINDSYGHMTGDRILFAFSRLL